MARRAHETTQELYFTRESESFIAPEVVEERLDRSVNYERRVGLGSFAVSRIIAEELVAQQELFGDANSLARAHMKQLAMPLHELIAAHNRNIQPQPETTEELKHIYKKTSTLLDAFIDQRDTLEHGLGSKVAHNQLSGAISELAFSALLLRSRHHHGYIPLPSERLDDHAPRDATGKRHAIDFVITRTDTPETEFGVQIKTSSSHIGPRYAQAVPIISLQELAGGEYHLGKYHLPESIVRDASGNASNVDTVRINKASKAAVAILDSIQAERAR